MRARSHRPGQFKAGALVAKPASFRSDQDQPEALRPRSRHFCGVAWGQTRHALKVISKILK